jgi:hypothetical protein
MKTTILFRQACTLFLVMLFSSLLAQQGGISGMVTDKNDKLPLPGAVIAATGNDSSRYGAVTDMNGQYLLDLKPGFYRVCARFIGYKEMVLTNISISDSLQNLNFELEEGNLTLNAIVCKSPVCSVMKCCSVTVVSGRSGTSKKKAGKKSNAAYLSTSSYNAPNVTNDAENSSIEESSGDLYGKLTAGQINDFGKWKMWNDISKNEFNTYSKTWKLYPLNRYPVQVVSEKGKAVIDAVLTLNDSKGNIIWTARTDNTGKAELWDEMFEERSAKEKSIILSYEGKEYNISSPLKFPDGMNMFRIAADCAVPDMVDIAVVVDATSSMDDEIEYLKSELVDILKSTKDTFPSLEISLGSVFYRCPGNSYVTIKSDFSTSLDKTLNFIRQQHSGEGGDEAVEQALDVAVNQLKWNDNARARLLLLVLDEPPAMNDTVIEKIQNVLQTAAAKGIRIIPVVGSGEGYDEDKNMEYLMRSLALATNGTYVFLTDHSQIGNSHTKPETDEYDVEILNDLLKRLICEYTFVPSCDKPMDAKDIKDTMVVYNPKIIAHEILSSKKYEQAENAKDTAFADNDYSNTAEYQAKKDSIDTAFESTVAQAEDNTTDTRKDVFHNFKYYPNPTDGILNIEFDGEVNEIFLSDVSGKLLEKYKVEEKKLMINISKYPSGIYFLQYSMGDKWLSGKVIKS